MLDVDNMRCENGLGLTTRMAERLNLNNIKPISRRLVIRGSGTQVFGTGKHRRMNQYKGKLSALQKDFDEKQKKIKAVK